VAAFREAKPVENQNFTGKFGGFQQNTRVYDDFYQGQPEVQCNELRGSCQPLRILAIASPLKCRGEK
jgi:hypothetical protein